MLTRGGGNKVKREEEDGRYKNSIGSVRRFGVCEDSCQILEIYRNAEEFAGDRSTQSGMRDCRALRCCQHKLKCNKLYLSES